MTASTSADFSLVTLVHGRAARAMACIETWLPFLAARADLRELLILDNGSTEAALLGYLAALPTRAPKVRVLHSPENLGVARGRDRLFAAARGTLIASLDDDLTLLDGRFFDVMRGLLRDPTVGVAGIAGAWQRSWRVSGNRDIPAASDHAGPVDWVAGCCQVFDRERLATAGVRLDLQFSPFWAEDVDFCLQVQAAGLRVLRHPPAGLADHTWGGSGRAWPKQFQANWDLLTRKWAGRGVARFERESPWLRRWFAFRYRRNHAPSP